MVIFNEFRFELLQKMHHVFQKKIFFPFSHITEPCLACKCPFVFASSTKLCDCKVTGSCLALAISVCGVCYERSSFSITVVWLDLHVFSFSLFRNVCNSYHYLLSLPLCVVGGLWLICACGSFLIFYSETYSFLWSNILSICFKCITCKCCESTCTACMFRHVNQRSYEERAFSVVLYVNYIYLTRVWPVFDLCLNLFKLHIIITVLIRWPTGSL